MAKTVTVPAPGRQAASFTGMLGRDEPFRAATMGLPHVWGRERTGDNLRRDALCGVARVAWIVRLVETGTGDDDRSMDVMEIARLGDLSDTANLGLSLTEAKQVLAAMQRKVVA